MFHTATTISKTSKCGRGQPIIDCLCNFAEGEAFTNCKVQVKMVYSGGYASGVWRQTCQGNQLSDAMNGKAQIALLRIEPMVSIVIKTLRKCKIASGKNLKRL